MGTLQKYMYCTRILLRICILSSFLWTLHLPISEFYRLHPFCTVWCFHCKRSHLFSPSPSTSSCMILDATSSPLPFNLCSFYCIWRQPLLLQKAKSLCLPISLSLCTLCSYNPNQAITSRHFPSHLLRWIPGTAQRDWLLFALVGWITQNKGLKWTQLTTS